MAPPRESERCNGTVALGDSPPVAAAHATACYDHPLPAHPRLCPQGCNQTWQDSVADYAKFHAEQLGKLKRGETPDARVSANDLLHVVLCVCVCVCVCMCVEGGGVLPLQAPLACRLPARSAMRPCKLSRKHVTLHASVARNPSRHPSVPCSPRPCAPRPLAA